MMNSAAALLRRSAAASSASPLRAALRRCSAAAASDRVSVTRGADGIVEVALSRPSKMNALDLPMFRAIQSAAASLVGDTSVRAVVLHGEGRAFCAGLDAKGFASNPLGFKAACDELLDRPDGEISNLAQDVAYLWRRIAAPVICATHGVCLGGGFQIALGADLRVSSAGCKFSVMEAKWGIIPDMSATVTLPELVPRDVAMELTMTGRIFEAPEALRLGLVTRVADEPLEEARRLAKEIAARSPDSTAAAKRLWHAAYAGADDGRALRVETELQRRLFGGWNQLAATARALGAPPVLTPGYAKRAPEWDAEADAEAEAQLRALLDGEGAEDDERRSAAA